MTESGTPRTDEWNRWIPPTTYGSNVYEEGHAYDSYFYCNGQRIWPVPQLSAEAELHKESSMYYDQGFWITRGDAINNPVMRARKIKDSDDEDDEEEEDDEEDEEEGEEEDRDDEDGSLERWQPISFTWDEADYSSYASYAGDQGRLRLQRADQWWTNSLLPNIYHGPLSAGYGGLNGDLPLLLGLVVFSALPQEVSNILTRYFQQGKWYPHSQNDTRGCKFAHKRIL